MIDQPISEFMNRRVLSGGADTPLHEVVRRMEQEIQSAFVVCEKGTPIGVITERDVVVVLSRAYAGIDQGAALAGDVMASPIHTLPENAEMGDVFRIMKERGFRRVPIVDDKNQLAGIVNIGELQNATNAALERRGRDLEAAVAARTAELQAANARLQELTRQDSLTGLLNRRAMGERIEELHAMARRYGNPYAVVLLDIDHFKLYNDTLGHPAGDEVIRTVATTIHDAIRISDTLYRYGGEEFLILLPETDVEGAALVCERVCTAVSSRAVAHPSSPTSAHVTISLGCTDVASRAIAGELSWEAVVERADAALYRSKQSGRNRFSVWTSTT